MTVRKLERKFEIAARTLCLSGVLTYILEMSVDARWWSVREECLHTVHTLL